MIKNQQDTSFSSFVKKNKIKFLLSLIVAIQIHKSTHTFDYYRPEVFARNRLKKKE
jgi:hypothetical protein